jgi:hypothetical protein
MKFKASAVLIVFGLLACHRASGQVDSATCGTSFTEGYVLESRGVAPQGYDTLQAVMENCPLYPNSYEGFSWIGGAAEVSIGRGYTTRPDFLAWLKQVLYLNPDTNWYCNDVDQMITRSKAMHLLSCQYADI